LLLFALTVLFEYLKLHLYAVLTKLVAEMNSILKHQHDGVSTVVIHTAALKFHSKCCEHVLLCSHDHCLLAPLERVMLNIVNSFQSAATSVMDMPRWRTVYVCSHFELNLVGLLSPCWYNFCTGRLPLVYYIMSLSWVWFLMPFAAVLVV